MNNCKITVISEDKTGKKTKHIIDTRPYLLAQADLAKLIERLTGMNEKILVVRIQYFE
jgi:hypothetical protein